MGPRRLHGRRETYRGALPPRCYARSLRGKTCAGSAGASLSLPRQLCSRLRCGPASRRPNTLGQPPVGRVPCRLSAAGEYPRAAKRRAGLKPHLLSVRKSPADDPHHHGGSGELEHKPEQFGFCFLAHRRCPRPCERLAGVSVVPKTVRPFFAPSSDPTDFVCSVGADAYPSKSACPVCAAPFPAATRALLISGAAGLMYSITRRLEIPHNCLHQPRCFTFFVDAFAPPLRLRTSPRPRTSACRYMHPRPRSR